MHTRLIRFSMMIVAFAAMATMQLRPTFADEVLFARDVMAVLSKSGCNMGTCHGNQNGKGGFKLSLRGENPDADFRTLTHDQNGRRINLLEANQSLLLLKATMQVPHEGGRRFDRTSPEYAIVHDWIANGMKQSQRDEPQLVTLVVTPIEQVLVEPSNSVKLQVVANFSDGSRHDVTRLACFEPSQPIVAVSVDGIVRREHFGEVTIAVRFLDQQRPVRLAFIPARPDFVARTHEAANVIDEHVFTKLRSLRMNPSPACDDTTFLRRAFLDLLGLPPTESEARAFTIDTQPDKRSRLIDKLLRRPEFADFWALKWADLLRVEEKTLDRKGVATFHAWIRDSVATNKPLDEFVRELVTARGSTYEHPPANFYRAMRDPITRAETVAQLFLGVRLQCAKCHNHPFDRWTQNDYYGWANQFARVKYEVLANNRRDRNDSHEFDGEQLVLLADEGDVKHPATDKPVPPRMLESSDDRDGPNRDATPHSVRRPPNATPTDRLIAVSEWLTSPNNRRFAESQVNRIWFHLLGKGIVDPIDDIRATNPPSNPALLAALTDDFVASGFDTHRLIRMIMNSRTYQLSSEPNESNREDETNFSHAAVRRLSAEQLADSIALVLDTPLDFNGYPAGTHAAQLAGVRAFRARESTPANGDRFLITFGKPPRLQACECERSEETTLAQTFQLVSGPILNELLSREQNRLASWLKPTNNIDKTINNLFWTILSRPPLPSEAAAMKKTFSANSNARANLEDTVWSLLNSDEFLLRR